VRPQKSTHNPPRWHESFLSSLHTSGSGHTLGQGSNERSMHCVTDMDWSFDVKSTLFSISFLRDFGGSTASRLLCSLLGSLTPNNLNLPFVTTQF
jgi:hypothetical protein